MVLLQDISVPSTEFITHNENKKDHFCDGLITVASNFEEKESSQQDM